MAWSSTSKKATQPSIPTPPCQSAPTFTRNNPPNSGPAAAAISRRRVPTSRSRQCGKTSQRFEQKTDAQSATETPCVARFDLLCCVPQFEAYVAGPTAGGSRKIAAKRSGQSGRLHTFNLFGVVVDRMTGGRKGTGFEHSIGNPTANRHANASKATEHADVAHGTSSHAWLSEVRTA